MPVTRWATCGAVVVLSVAGCQRSWREAETIAVVPDVDAARPSVASNGHAIVVWMEDVEDVEDGPIWAIRRDAEGSWQAAEQVGVGHAPAGAVDPSGGAVVVWQQGIFESSRVLASRRTPAGWGPAELLEPGRSEDIRVAMDAAGNALAVYDAELGIMARLHDGVAWRQPEVVAPPGTGSRVFMNDAGDAFATWINIVPDGGDDSLFRALVGRRGPGGVWTEPHRLAGVQSSGATIAVDEDGSAQAFWGQQNAGIWFERFLEPGGWQGPRQLTPAARSEVAAGDGGGDAGVAWLLVDEIVATYLVDGEPGELVTLAQNEEDAPPFADFDLDIAAADGDAIAIWRLGTRIEVSRGDRTGSQPPAVLDEGTVFRPRVQMFGSGDALAVWLRRIADGNIEIRSRIYH